MAEARCLVAFKEEGVFLLAMTDERPAGVPYSVFRYRDHLVKLAPMPTSSELGGAVREALDRAGTLAPPESGQAAMAAVWESGQRGLTGLFTMCRYFDIRDDGTGAITIGWMPADLGSIRTEKVESRDSEEIGRFLIERHPLCARSEPLSAPRLGTSYRGAHPQGEIPAPDPTIRLEDRPERFGYKLRWFAIDTMDAGAVVAAIGLQNVRRASWSVDPYHHPGVFVSPSVLGWTFVLGWYVEPHRPEFIPLMQDWSRRLGEVQYFCTHRVVEYHGWVEAIGGEIVRGYAFTGERSELVMDLGELTPDERELGFAAFIDRRSIKREDWDDVRFPVEDDVMGIAGRWSIDPREIGAYDPEGPGYLGYGP
jgi:hypothetical protein